MKKVLIVSYGNLEKHGTSSVINSIVCALSNCCDFTILSFDGNIDDFYYNQLIKKGCKVINYKFPKLENVLIKILWRIGYRILYYRKVITTILKSQKFDVIHSFKEVDNDCIFKVAKSFGVPIRIFHNNSVYNPKIKKYIHRRFKNAVKYSTNLVTVSKKAGDCVFGSLNYLLLKNYVDPALYKNKNLKKDSLVQVGSFSSNKNQLFTLSVFENVKKSFPKLKLNLIGFENEPGYQKKLTNFIIKNQIKDVFFLPGNVDCQYYYNKAFVTLFPSFSESYGLVAVESQLCGTFLLASKFVPNDTNLGLACYEELNIEKWALLIKRKIRNRSLKQKISIDTRSLSNFEENLKTLYKIN